MTSVDGRNTPLPHLRDIYTAQTACTGSSSDWRRKMVNKKKSAPAIIESIAGRILVLRGQRVMLDADLAALYGVETRVLNQAVKRNLERFPTDFMFQLSTEEFENWRSQLVMSKPGARMGLRRAPAAFTEHGALMTAMIINTPHAIEVSVYVVRAFVRLRETLSEHKELAAKLEELEQKTEALAMRHDTFAANTRAQLRQVFEAIRELMIPPEPKRRPIGFITPEERKRG